MPNPSTTKHVRRAVLIDVGHGPRPASDPKGTYDPGMTTWDGWHEAHVNLVTAYALRDTLVGFGHRADLTPFGLSLADRGRRAAAYDVFISIHHNAFNRRSQGTEVAVHRVHATDADRDLAATLSKIVSETLAIEDRGVIPLGLAVLSAARQTRVKACVLSEGFFADVDGVPIFEWAQREGVALARGIDAWCKTKLS